MSAGNAARPNGRARGPVQDGCEGERAFCDFERTDADVYGKLDAVLSHGQELKIRTHWPEPPTRGEPRTLARVAPTVAIGNQQLDRSADELALTVTEHPLGGSVRNADLT
jgi:hypothetical protein